MRRLLFLLLLGSAVVGLANVTAAGATKVTVDPVVQGTYTYRDGGMRITVGYICPGATTSDGVTDPHARFYALVMAHGPHGGSSVSITRHSPAKLDQSLYEFFGLHLSDTAFQVLVNDAATIACSSGLDAPDTTNAASEDLLSTPPVSKPPVTTPPVSAPPVSTPPVSAPPVSTPPVSTPAVSAPAVSTRRVSSPST